MSMTLSPSSSYRKHLWFFRKFLNISGRNFIYMLNLYVNIAKGKISEFDPTTRILQCKSMHWTFDRPSYINMHVIFFLLISYQIHKVYSFLIFSNCLIKLIKLLYFITPFAHVMVNHVTFIFPFTQMDSFRPSVCIL